MGFLKDSNSEQKTFRRTFNLSGTPAPMRASKALRAISQSQISLVDIDTDFKLCKMREVAQTDKELIEIQRKAIYLQRLEYQSLVVNHEALQRNFAVISKNLQEERTQREILQQAFNGATAAKRSLELEVRALQDKLGSIGHGDLEYD
jgi:hypothetical protein